MLQELIQLQLNFHQRNVHPSVLELLCILIHSLTNNIIHTTVKYLSTYNQLQQNILFIKALDMYMLHISQGL